MLESGDKEKSRALKLSLQVQVLTTQRTTFLGQLIIRCLPT